MEQPFAAFNFVIGKQGLIILPQLKHGPIIRHCHLFLGVVSLRPLLKLKLVENYVAAQQWSYVDALVKKNRKCLFE